MNTYHVYYFVFLLGKFYARVQACEWNKHWENISNSDNAGVFTVAVKGL